MNATLQSSITLTDGRRLAYDEQGDPQGWPVVLFHGVPGSRLQRHPDASIATRVGVHLITVDRPGYGLSDTLPGRTIMDWSKDVEQLADALRLEHFSIIGVSGGGVFALACAYKLADRIDKVALISCPAPLDAPGMLASLPRPQRLQFLLAARVPWAVQLMFGAYLRSAQKLTPAAIRRKLEHELPEAERVHLSTPGFVDMLLADTTESARSGPGAIASELALIARPWGFPLDEIIVPVRLWQGMEDTNVSPEMGSYLADVIPNCEATFCPGEAHLVGFTHWEAIVRAVGGSVHE